MYPATLRVVLPTEAGGQVAGDTQAVESAEPMLSMDLGVMQKKYLTSRRQILYICVTKSVRRWNLREVIFTLS